MSVSQFKRNVIIIAINISGVIYRDCIILYVCCEIKSKI
jgi:hypothetical protein